MLLIEVVGKTDKAVPEQIGPTAAKLGVIFGFTVMVKVVGIAHTPAVGVKVYVVGPTVAVFTVDGLQLPATLLLEVVGKMGAGAP